MRISKKLYRIAFFVSLAGLFILSSIPELPVQTDISGGKSDFRFDYLFHFLAYATITFLYIKSYTPNVKGFLLIIVLAALEELHQHYIPGRTVNPVDFVCDIAGMLLIGLVWWISSVKSLKDIVTKRRRDLNNEGM